MKLLNRLIRERRDKMLDNFCLRSNDYSIIKHLDKSFFEKRKFIFEKIYNQNAYFLYNPEDSSNKSPLRIQIYDEGGCIIITRSIRKWHFGEKSLQDLDLKTFIDAIKILSSALEIPFELFCQFSFSMAEIGLNIKVSEECSNILDMIVGFKSSCYETATYSGYKKFKTASFEIKLYDKLNQIIGKKNQRKFIKSTKETEFINKNEHKNCLRVELKISHGKNLTKRIGYKTVGEMINNFNELYLYFWVSIQDLQFSEIYTKIPIFDSENKSDKEFMDYLKIVGINMIGIEKINQMVSKLKYRGMRSKIKTIYENPLIEFSTFSKKRFCMNVMGQIVLGLIKSDQTKFAKELVPQLRLNSTYNTI